MQVSILAVHAGMVCRGAHAGALEEGGHGFRIPPGPDVQDGAAFCPACPIGHGFMPTRDLQNPESEVVPAHGHAEPRWIPQCEEGLDVSSDTGGRRGCQCNPAGFRMPFPKGRKVEVVLAEGVSPLADAMGLIHRHRSDRHRKAGRSKVGLNEPFRRHEEKATRAVLEGRQRPLDFLRVLARCDGCGADSSPLQTVDLIRHEGHKGADDEADSSAIQSRNLIPDGFPASRGQDGEHIAPRSRSQHHRLLRRAEARMAPMPFEQNLELMQGRTRWCS